MPDHKKSFFENFYFPVWILVVGLVTALGPLSTDMYLAGFPLIETEFSVPHPVVQFTLTAFLAGLAIGQLFYGPLSDRVGRKSPLYIGLTVYFFASIGCYLANSIFTLIFFRFLQGLGGCAGMVVGRAIVRDRLGVVGSAKAFSTMMLVVAIGPMVAPVLGGWMIHAGWRIIFASLATLSLILLVSVRYKLQESLTSYLINPPTFIGIFRQYAALLRDRKFFLCLGLGGGLHASSTARLCSRLTLYSYPVLWNTP